VQLWKTLQRGESVGGYTPDMVLGEVRRGLHVTYATDTRPTDMIATMATDADLLILEGMFGEESKENRARETCHMTIPEAASLAREAAPPKTVAYPFQPLFAGGQRVCFAFGVLVAWW